MRHYAAQANDMEQEKPKAQLLRTSLCYFFASVLDCFNLYCQLHLRRIARHAEADTEIGTVECGGSIGAADFTSQYRMLNASKFVDDQGNWMADAVQIQLAIDGDRFITIKFNDSSLITSSRKLVYIEYFC